MSRSFRSFRRLFSKSSRSAAASRRSRRGCGIRACEWLEPRAMLTAFSYGAGALQLVVDNLNETLVISATGSNGYSISSSHDFTGTDIGGELTGNGTKTLTVNASLGLTTAFVTDSQRGATVEFGTSSAGATYSADFFASLAIPGSGTIRVTDTTAFSGGHGLSAAAVRITVEAPLSSALGSLTLDADEGLQAVGTAAGVVVSPTGSVTTAGGPISISGRGGDALLGGQVGVSIEGTVAAGDDGTNFGSITIDGIGGLSAGDGGGNHGVVLATGAVVRTTGGAVSVRGRGAAVNGDDVGIVLAGRLETAATAGASGAVSLEGFGGGGLAGTSGNYGVWLQSTGQVSTAGGAVDATGHGGVGNPLGFFPFTDSPGLYVDNGRVQSLTGPLSFTADSFYGDVSSGGAISTAASVSLRNAVAGQVFELGADLNPLLESIVASQVIVGRDDLQPVIVQAEGPGGGLTLPAGTALDLVASSISLRAPVVTPGAVQSYRGTVRLGDLFPSADVMLTGAAARFMSPILGGGRSLLITGDADFSDVVSGLVDLSVSGRATLAADITTSGVQTFDGLVTLAAPLVDLTAASGAFGAGVSGAGHALAIDFGGATAIDGNSFVGLSGLSTGNGGTTVLSGSLTTSGPQSFGDDVSLSGDATLTTGGHDLTFAGLLDGRRNLSIGAGSGAVTFAANVGGTAALASLALSSASGVTGKGTLAIDGSAVGAVSNGLVISGVGNVDFQVPGSSVQNCIGTGVVMNASPGTLLSGFTIRDNGAYGLYAAGDSVGAVIAANTIGGNAVGIYLAGAGGLVIDGGNQIVGNDSYGVYATGVASRTTVIRGNTIDGQGGGVYGVFLDNAKNIHVGEAGNGNHITRSLVGIQASQGLASSEVVGNVVDHNGTGMVLSNTRHFAVKGDNRILDNATYGLLAMGEFIDTAVSGNTVSGSVVGMYLSGASGLVIDGGNQIIGNSTHGIYVGSLAAGTFIVGNTIVGAGAGTFGIFLDSSGSIRIGDIGQGNHVSGSAVGIYGRGGLAGGVIRGNTIDHNGSGVVLSGAVGVLVDGGNTIADSTAYGLFVEGAAPGTSITGNTIDRNVAGVVISDGSGVVVSGGNQIIGNSSYGVFATGSLGGSRITGNVVDGQGAGTYGLFLNAATGGHFGDTGDGNIVSGWSVGMLAQGQSTGSVIRANAVEGNGTGGVIEAAQGLLVDGGNRFSRATSYGLLAKGDCTGTSVVGNTIDQNEIGVSLSGARGLSLVGANQIVANAVHGIYATGDASGTMVAGNVVNGSSLTSYGVFLDSVTGLSLGDIHAGDINTITGNATGIFARGGLIGTTIVNNVVAGNQSAMVLSAAGALTVQGGNRCVGSSAFGLYATGDCAATSVEGNDFEGNSSGVVLEDARNLTVVGGNRLISNTAFGLYAKGDSGGTTVLGNTITVNGLDIDTTAAVGGTFQLM
jgi:parallel beta-helix repeat protein